MKRKRFVEEDQVLAVFIPLARAPKGMAHRGVYAMGALAAQRGLGREACPYGHPGGSAGYRNAWVKGHQDFLDEVTTVGDLLDGPQGPEPEPTHGPPE